MSAGCGGPPAGDPGEAGFPGFTRHEIPFPEGYYATSFDVDRDGRSDIVALSSRASALAWFRNPSWERFEITTASERFIHMAPHDIDGDGDLDLAVASRFSLGNSLEGGLIHWAEAPQDPVAIQEWALHPIDEIPTSHRLAWGDIDGDGSRELLNLPIVGVGAEAPEYRGAVRFTAYRIPADPRGAWQSQLLDDSRLEVAHGFSVVDWDGDGAEDLLTASNDGIFLFRPSLGGQPLRIGSGHDGLRPDRGSSEVRPGSLAAGRFLAALEPWHGTDLVLYTPGDAPDGMWSRRVIGSEFSGGHGLAVADLDADGQPEIVAGGRDGERLLLIYRYRPGTGLWERIVLDQGGVAVSSAEVHDLSGDGAPDILAVGVATSNIVWYENTP